MTGGRRGWIAAVSIALLFSIAIARAAVGDIEVRGIVCGWAVAAASSAVALFLNRRSIGPDSTRFLRYGLLGHGLRFLAVVGLLVGFPLISDGSYVSFAIALVISYIVLMSHEIWTLHVAGLTAACPETKNQSGGKVLEQRSDGHK